MPGMSDYVVMVRNQAMAFLAGPPLVKAATGEVAEIFADIRATMDIPMLTSIWRTLVAVDGGLPAGWQAVKPLYQTGIPATALARVIDGADLPLPEPWIYVGLPPTDLAAAQAIVDAYNRSNGMNMIALSALVVVPDAAAVDDTAAPSGRYSGHC